MGLEGIVKELDRQRLDGPSVAQKIFDIPGILDVLSHRVGFLSVAYGENPGIYEDWYVDIVWVTRVSHSPAGHRLRRLLGQKLDIHAGGNLLLSAMP
jgi:hypothetical protein